MISPTPTIPGWPEAGWAGPVGCAYALACFDSLAVVEPEFMISRWRGAGLPPGHPLDGVLEALGWIGKAFESADRVYPLLFRTGSGAAIPLDPGFMPVSVALRWPALAKSAPFRLAFAAGRRLFRSNTQQPGCEPRTFGKSEAQP
jgi:hypothetical protein